MADNRLDPGPGDGKQVSISQEHEIRYWTKALGVDRDRLRELVRTVGKSAKRLRSHLGLNKE